MFLHACIDSYYICVCVLVMQCIYVILLAISFCGNNEFIVRTL